MSRHVLGKIDNYHHRTTRNAYIGNIHHSSRLIIRHKEFLVHRLDHRCMPVIMVSSIQSWVLWPIDHSQRAPAFFKRATRSPLRWAAMTFSTPPRHWPPTKTVGSAWWWVEDDPPLICLFPAELTTLFRCCPRPMMSINAFSMLAPSSSWSSSYTSALTPKVTKSRFTTNDMQQSLRLNTTTAASSTKCLTSRSAFWCCWSTTGPGANSLPLAAAADDRSLLIPAALSCSPGAAAAAAAASLYLYIFDIFWCCIYPALLFHSTYFWSLFFFLNLGSYMGVSS